MPCHGIDHDMAWHPLIDIASTPTSCARRAAPTPSMARRHSHRAKISTPPAGPVDRSGSSGHVWGTTICDKPEFSGMGWLCKWLPPAKFLNLVDLVDLLVYLLRVQDCNEGYRRLKLQYCYVHQYIWHRVTLLNLIHIYYFLLLYPHYYKIHNVPLMPGYRPACHAMPWHRP